MKYAFFTLFFSAGFIFISCGGDDKADCTQAQFTTEVNNAINAVNVAGQAWANDPTTSNCNAFLSAANNYLDVVEGFKGCGALAQSDYQQAIDSARDSIDAIPGC